METMLLLFRKKTQWQLERPRHVGKTISPICFHFQAEMLCVAHAGEERSSLGPFYLPLYLAFLQPRSTAAFQGNLQSQQHNFPAGERREPWPTLLRGGISLQVAEAFPWPPLLLQKKQCPGRMEALKSWWLLYSYSLAWFTPLKKLPPKSIMTSQQCGKVFLRKISILKTCQNLALLTQMLHGKDI